MYSDETTKEAAKAVQETAKAVQPITELAAKAAGFVGKVIGGPCEQLGGIIEDTISLYRFKNLCAIADEVQIIQHKRKIEGKTVVLPPRLAIPLLHAAALEDDETLQGVWARLIANSTDPNFKTALHPGFIEVVRGRRLLHYRALRCDAYGCRPKRRKIVLNNQVTKTQS